MFKHDDNCDYKLFFQNKLVHYLPILGIFLWGQTVNYKILLEKVIDQKVFFKFLPSTKIFYEIAFTFIESVDTFLFSYLVFL